MVTITGPGIGFWQAYTPTLTSFGTASGVSFSYSIVGKTLHIQGRWINGTGAASEAQITLPTGYTSAADYPTLSVVGYGCNSTTDQTIIPLIEVSKAYMVFGKENSAVAGLTKANGNAFTTNGTQSINAIIRVT